MHPKELRIADFRYDLPLDRIADYPLPERDASKLLIYKEGKISEDQYRNIADYIPAQSLMVFNQTKVVPARLLFQKPTGGMIEVFCLEPSNENTAVQSAMLQTERVIWNCFVGGAAKWKENVVLSAQVDNLVLNASIVERCNGYFKIELSWNHPEKCFAEVLQIIGKIPLPPYLHRKAEQSDSIRYQTIYASSEGSVAAPTAGLHFTEAVMQSLNQKSIQQAFVTLHVGAGTFAPVKTEKMELHSMHAEWIDISVDVVKNLIDHHDNGIVAVGTTSLRMLESLYWIGLKLIIHSETDFSKIAVSQWDPYEMNLRVPPKEALQAVLNWFSKHESDRLITRTQILIAPSYEFKIVRGLVTNFHQPQSTLLLLVAALIGEDWKKVYDYALRHQFRFLSYGDGSLLWKNDVNLIR
ncbi:MAG: S-adenosylmethionine:tRNA ribosyltransferase-isomerase [Bacteroidetes bacterium]|nr:S-adenosylmethionine:tRNA ribosyltransferase-isomerase [Bacteroidota bacterium]